MLDLKFRKEALSLRKNIKKRNQQKLMRNKYNLYDTSLSSLVVNGGIPLKGTIQISGAKNAALPLLFATILSNEKITLNNVPNLSDILLSIDILNELGAKVEFSNNQLVVDPSNINNFSTDPNLVGSMRASVLMLGPLLTKFGTAKIVTPGGCTIGKRPIDIHLKCLEQMGANIDYKDDHINLTAPNGLQGTNLTMEKSSVGATENLIMAATLAKGTTKITNPAKEPEVLDLIQMLKHMGAQIEGEGTNLIIIKGVNSLKGTQYTVCPDRIEAGSYLIAAAITKGAITLNNINYKHISNIVSMLSDIGCELNSIENNVSLKVNKELVCKNITTEPYPGFPTDLQPQWTSLMTLAKGSCIINETIFENRLGHTKELIKMGANIELIDNIHSFKVHGVKELTGANLFPTDLRSSFALIIAALGAKGISTIYNLSFLDRGYENSINKLKQCGANVTRIDGLKTECNNINKHKFISIT